MSWPVPARCRLSASAIPSEFEASRCRPFRRCSAKRHGLVPSPPADTVDEHHEQTATKQQKRTDIDHCGAGEEDGVFRVGNVVLGPELASIDAPGFMPLVELIGRGYRNGDTDENLPRRKLARLVSCS